MNISATSVPITIIFYQKRICDKRKAAFGFAPDRIKTLVCMTTDRVIMEKNGVATFSRQGQIWKIRFFYVKKMETVNFSEIIAASDLKIRFMKVCEH